MKKEYDIDIIIDSQYSQPKIVIYADKKSKEIDEIVDAINKSETNTISAYSNGKIIIINKNDILRIRRYGRQVYLETETDSYILKKSITQLEEELDNKRFIRISQSEIINAYKVIDLDVSFVGTIVIGFVNGVKTNVSRRYVKVVKDFFENNKGVE